MNNVLTICRLFPDLKRVLNLMLPADDDRQYDGDAGEHQCQRRPLYSECRIVDEVGSRIGGIKLKDRELGYDAAVRQAEDDVLCKVPCRVRAEGQPDAVEVVHDQRVEHRDCHQVQDRHQRDTVVKKVQ